MITKKGSLIAAPLLHVAQNQGVKKLLGNKTFHKSLWENFYNGVTGNKIVSKDGARLIHGLGPAIPEVKILANEAHHAGEQLKLMLANNGGNLNKRSLVQLRRVARAQFGKLLKRPLKPHEIDAATDLFAKTFRDKNGTAALRDLLSNLTYKKARELENLSIDNPLTGKLLKGVFSNAHTPSPRAITPTSIENSKAALQYGIPAEVVTNGFLAGVDPITMGINLAKRGLFSKEIGNKVKPIKWLQDKSTDAFLMKPIKKSFETAGGPDTRINRFTRNTIMPDVVNPINAYAADFAAGLGKIKNM